MLLWWVSSASYSLCQPLRGSVASVKTPSRRRHLRTSLCTCSKESTFTQRASAARKSLLPPQQLTTPVKQMSMETATPRHQWTQLAQTNWHRAQMAPGQPSIWTWRNGIWMATLLLNHFITTRSCGAPQIWSCLLPMQGSPSLVWWTAVTCLHHPVLSPAKHPPRLWTGPRGKTRRLD